MTRVKAMLTKTIKINPKSFLSKNLKKGGFGFNIGAMMAGNVTAQLIGFLLAPIITRLYLPEHFGVMSVIISLVSVFATISCLRYETAIVLPKEDESALNLLPTCAALTFTVTLILLISLVFIDDWVESLVKLDGQKLLFYLVPLGVLAHGFEKTLTFWFVRKKNFPLLAKMRFIIPLSASGLKIIAGLAIGSTALWLIIGDLAGIMIVAIILAIIFYQGHHKQLIESISIQNLKAVASEYIKFPKYSSATAFMNALSINMPAFLFAFYFSFEFIGYYSLAAKMLKKPVQLVSNSINGVLLQHFAELQAKGKSQKSNYLKSTLTLASIGIVPFTLIAVAGEWIFTIVFGAKWHTAGVCAQILSPWLFLLFINSPATQMILVKQKLFYQMVFHISVLSFRIIAIIIGHHLSPNPLISVALFSGVGVVANLVLIVYAYTLTMENES